MKNTILYKLLKWILGGNAVTFFAILISGVIFILSRYPDILEYRGMKIDWNTQLRDCYNLFNSDSIAPFCIPTEEDTSHYCHILIVDRTMSGKDLEETNLDTLKDSLYGDLFKRNYTKGVRFNKNTNDTELTIQHYLTLKYYRQLSLDKKWDGLIVFFFDGDGDGDAKTKTITPFERKDTPKGIQGDIYHRRTDDNTVAIIGELRDEPLLKKLSNQTSNFRKLFTEINKLLKDTPDIKNSKIILTIISDFYHDAIPDIILPDDVTDFKRGNQGKISQYNLIHCVPNKDKNKEKSQKLIDKLRNALEGIVNFVPISTEVYSSIEPEQQITFLNNEFLECLNPIIESNRSTIKFTYPEKNEQGIEVTKAHIKLPDTIQIKGNKFKWHLKALPKHEDPNLFISYRTDEDEEFEKIPLVSSGFKDDATELHFEIETGILNTLLQKRIMLKTQSNGIYGIHSFDFNEARLSKPFKQLAITILNGLCISLILIFISGTVLLCFYLKRIRNFQNKERNWLNGIGGGIILLVNGYAIYFLCPCSNCYLWTTFLIVLGCIFANGRYIYLFIRKKWAE
jgi:hypothetical protein